MLSPIRKHLAVGTATHGCTLAEPIRHSRVTKVVLIEVFVLVFVSEVLFLVVPELHGGNPKAFTGRALIAMRYWTKAKGPGRLPPLGPAPWRRLPRRPGDPWFGRLDSASGRRQRETSGNTDGPSSVLLCSTRLGPAAEGSLRAHDCSPSCTCAAR
jgi:hypothetical protein